MPSRAGSTVAMPCHMVRSMEGKHGGSTLEIKTNVAQFFPPWTVTRDVWHDALRPDVSGVAVDALFHEADS